MNYIVQPGVTLYHGGRTYKEGDTVTELDLPELNLEMLTLSKHLIADKPAKAPKVEAEK